MKVSLVVILGLLGAAALRKRSAAFRHWILASAIIAAAATPVLEYVVPSWEMPFQRWTAQSAGPLRLIASGTVIRLDDQLPSDNDGSGTRRFGLLQLAGWTWAAGAVISLSMLLAGLVRLMRLASQSQVIERGRWTALAEDLSRGFGPRLPVTILQSDHPTLLVTWGVWRPKVLLPRDAGAWTDDRARIVLGHEFAHIHRRDWVVQIVGELLKSVYWFNPLVWIACRRLRLESEQACDDAVLGLGVEGVTYATHLLDLAHACKEHRAPMVPAPALVRPSSLERRVSAMLNARLNRTPMRRAAAAGITLAAAATAVWIAGLVVSAQATTATYSGALLDTIGHMMPSTTISLTHALTKQKFDATSDQSGHFTFTGLPAGEYTLETRVPGFETSQGKLTLTAGQNLAQDVALQVGGLVETIRVVYSPDDPPTPTTRGPLRPKIEDRCGQSPIGGCIMPPVKVFDVKPIYPRAKGQAGADGKVELLGRLGTDGFIKDLRVVGLADPEFVNAAVEAVRRWEFTTTRLDGVPIEVNFQIHVSFAMQY